MNTHTHTYTNTYIHEYVWMCIFCCCSVAKSCLTLRDPMDCSMPDFLVLHYHSEFAQIHVWWVSDAIQPSHPQPLSSSFAFNLSQHQGLFQHVSSSHHVVRVLEFQLHHQHIPKYIYIYIYPSLSKMHGCWEILIISFLCVCFFYLVLGRYLIYSFCFS